MNSFRRIFGWFLFVHCVGHLNCVFSMHYTSSRFVLFSFGFIHLTTEQRLITKLEWETWKKIISYQFEMSINRTLFYSCILLGAFYFSSNYNYFGSCSFYFEHSQCVWKLLTCALYFMGGELIEWLIPIEFCLQ